MKKTLLHCLLTTCLCAPVFAFEAEDYEEPAGGSFLIVASPGDGVYGIAICNGTWLKHTPVFGDFQIGLFQNDIEDALFTGVGMTLRVMPHWSVAPFVGGGGSFNYALTSGTAAGGDSGIPAENIIEAEQSGGQSYWGGHAEVGVRWSFESRFRMVEAFGRYTWSSTSDDAGYWLIGIASGAGW